MSNKFKIRNLENEKRRIDKEIDKLRREDVEGKVEKKVILSIKENRTSVIDSVSATGKTDKNTKEIVMSYTFARKGDVITCTVVEDLSGVVGKGVSKCHEDDYFSHGVGCVLAERRAVADFYNKLVELEVARHN